MGLERGATMIGATARWLLLVLTVAVTVLVFSALLPVEPWIYAPAAVLITAILVPRMAKDMKLPLHGSLTDASDRYVSRHVMITLAVLWVIYFGVAYAIDRRETLLILLVVSPIVYCGLEGIKQLFGPSYATKKEAAAVEQGQESPAPESDPWAEATHGPWPPTRDR